MCFHFTSRILQGNFVHISIISERRMQKIPLLLQIQATLIKSDPARDHIVTQGRNIY